MKASLPGPILKCGCYNASYTEVEVNDLIFIVKNGGCGLKGCDVRDFATEVRSLQESCVIVLTSSSESLEGFRAMVKG